jgi:hypothetical protein
VTAWGGAFLQYPPGTAKTLILVIETAAMLSIATALVLAFVGGRPAPCSPGDLGGKS